MYLRYERILVIAPENIMLCMEPNFITKNIHEATFANILFAHVDISGPVLTPPPTAGLLAPPS